MRSIVAALLIVACVAGAAVAQDAPPAPSERPRITWEEMPNGRDFARNYPDLAADNGVPGAAVLCCTVNAQRELDCDALIEWPQDFGFGEASLQVARKFRVSEESYAALQATGDMSIRRTIRWTLNREAPNLDRAVEIMQQASCPIPAGAPGA